MSSSVAELVAAARVAGKRLSLVSGPERRAVLLAMADLLERGDKRAVVLAANKEDLEDAEQACARGELGRALVNRLVLNQRKFDELCSGLRKLASQPDLIGQTTLARELDEGLTLRRVTCPLGVLGVVFEARPDAVAQISGLAMRTGNAVVLKGGKEAQRSNSAMIDLLRQALSDQGLDPAAIVGLQGREEVSELLALEGKVDLIVARGGAEFVQYVMSSTTIPVLGHAEGLCHIYLHSSAQPEMAARIVVDAKCGYAAACNAVETLLWEPGADRALDACVYALREEGVELRGCPATRERNAMIAEATDEDWATEYGARILSIKQVPDLYSALAHIEHYGSGHTEAIIGSDDDAANTFLAAVDAAGVFHNASTRFADGYRYGLGAEVGISTSKMHARGPVGVEGLVSYRWLLRGSGQVASDYGVGGKAFTHKDLG